MPATAPHSPAPPESSPENPLAKARTRPVADLSFEDAMAELEQIVRALEEGRQTLEDALAAYERGTALRQHCEARLAEVEARINAIVVTEDGLATRPVA
jgi:exodeoxyribonuclease VII small subunit